MAQEGTTGVFYWLVARVSRRVGGEWYPGNITTLVRTTEASLSHPAVASAKTEHPHGKLWGSPKPVHLFGNALWCLTLCITGFPHWNLNLEQQDKEIAKIKESIPSHTVPHLTLRSCLDSYTSFSIPLPFGGLWQALFCESWPEMVSEPYNSILGEHVDGINIQQRDGLLKHICPKWCRTELLPLSFCRRYLSNREKTLSILGP